MRVGHSALRKPMAWRYLCEMKPHEAFLCRCLAIGSMPLNDLSMSLKFTVFPIVRINYSHSSDSAAVIL